MTRKNDEERKEGKARPGKRGNKGRDGEKARM